MLDIELLVSLQHQQQQHTAKVRILCDKSKLFT